MARRLRLSECFGVLIDVQELFLAELKEPERSETRAAAADLAGLLSYLRVPVVVTLERPVAEKGGLAKDVARRLGPGAATFEKDFFDLTKEPRVREHLKTLGRRQAIVAGSETDVCVLQSCLGLLELGLEVHLVEDATFTSSKDARAALERLKSEGVVVSSYKTVYYELLEAVENSRHRKKLLAAAGPFPKRLTSSVNL
ncbi:MAG: isochorismatase family protein [Proteobacteria bacterium]|nr:isochorismatase family protein [Pseudomonadota bacterium]